MICVYIKKLFIKDEKEKNNILMFLFLDIIC